MFICRGDQRENRFVRTVDGYNLVKSKSDLCSDLLIFPANLAAVQVLERLVSVNVQIVPFVSQPC